MGVCQLKTILFNGEQTKISAVAKTLGVSYITMTRRIENHAKDPVLWPMDRVLSPGKMSGGVLWEGKSRTYAECATMLNITEQEFAYRWRKHRENKGRWPIEWVMRPSNGKRAPKATTITIKKQTSLPAGWGIL